MDSDAQGRLRTISQSLYENKIAELEAEVERLQNDLLKTRTINGQLGLQSVEFGGQIDRLREALEFYANPETYFAIALLTDPPCGDFATDESETNTELGIRPGKRAREALKDSKRG